MKKIGIIGYGKVAQTLANGFIKHGFQVLVGTRDQSKLFEWKSKVGTRGSIGNFTDAAQFGNILILAVKGAGIKDALQLAGINNLNGKIIIDASNPITDLPPVNGLLCLFTGKKYSLMEQIQQMIPHANFVKAFNSVGNTIMINPVFNEGKPTMFICGNNSIAKQEVSKLVRLFGFDPADMGSAKAARAIEPLSMLGCVPGFRGNNWSYTFKLSKN